MNSYTLSEPVHVDDGDLTHVRWTYGPFEIRKYTVAVPGSVRVCRLNIVPDAGVWIDGDILEAVALAQQMEEGVV